MDDFTLDLEDEDVLPDKKEIESNVSNETDFSKEGKSPIKILFDEEANALGFQSPFAIVIKPVDEFDKGLFIKELVANNVKFKDDKELGAKYRTFVQRLFNFSDSAFHDPKSLEQEVNKVTTSLNGLTNSIGNVSIKDYQATELPVREEQ